jgi:hypothetical protein
LRSPSISVSAISNRDHLLSARTTNRPSAGSGVFAATDRLRSHNRHPADDRRIRGLRLYSQLDGAACPQQLSPDRNAGIAQSLGKAVTETALSRDRRCSTIPAAPIPILSALMPSDFRRHARSTSARKPAGGCGRRSAPDRERSTAFIRCNRAGLHRISRCDSQCAQSRSATPATTSTIPSASRRQSRASSSVT